MTNEVFIPEPPSIKVGIGNLAIRFVKKAATWGIIYLWGYFSISPGWLLGPLVLNVLRYQWKKEKEFRILSAQAQAKASEKEVILARVQDLPAWVFFPDFERVEWLNRVADQLWPSIGHFITNLLKTQVEPLIKKSLESYSLNDFNINHVLLGNIPPRIGGIKCYDKNTARNEIILDLDLTWAGDSDIQVSIKGMRASILDLYIHGSLRVVLKPLIHNFPLVGGIQVYFLNNPNIDFAVGGLANVTDLPGISSILRRVLAEQLAGFLVLPNKLSIPLVHDIPMKVFKCPEPEGVLRITLVEAKNLMRMDFGFFGNPAKSDPYVVLSVGAKKFKSRTVMKTIDPVYGETWEAIVEVVKGQILDIEVWDFNQGTSDNFMGRVSVPIRTLADRGESDLWVNLEEATSGQVRIQTQWMTMSSDRDDYDDRVEEAHGRQLSTAVLMVYVDSCKQLPLAKAGISTKPDPIVQVSIASSAEPQETWSVKYSRNPVYEQGFVFLVNNPEVDDLDLRVYDEKTKADLGLLRLGLANLFKREGMEYFNQPFKLKRTGCESSVTLHLQLYFTRKVPRRVRTRRSRSVQSGEMDLDSISLLGDDSEDESETDQQNLQKLSIISGGSVESLAQPELRQRKNMTTRDVKNVDGKVVSGPRILVSLQYNDTEEILAVTIHRAVELPSENSYDLPDPFVKLILLPDRPKKRKTEYVQECTSPEWEETFEYSIPRGQVRDKEIDLVVVNRKGLFCRFGDMFSVEMGRSADLCRTILQLCDCCEITGKTTSRWFSLSRPDSPKLEVGSFF
eukprot:GFUD01000433.1.p1 GENE.GFUD01000433.1~~GFUD01000433.1.p1  ORF type:complete len:792 (+),score=178.56 GFUD01000433.1:116-2491(+)